MAAALWTRDPRGWNGRLLGSWWPPASARAPMVIRRELVAVFEREGVGRDLRDAVQTVVTELVTNAIDHAGPPVRVRLAAFPTLLRIEVHDGCPDAPRIRPIDPTAVRGRGLQMVDSLCERWSWIARDHGKVVWAEVASG